MAARAAVEALLRERKLDRTLTSTLPERLGEDAVAAFGTDTLDRALSGGLPRGQVSEVVGPASSGRTSFAWAALAAATLRGESVALIDTFDRFDPPTAHACGIELSRLLWVRGQAVSKTAVAIDPAWLPGVRAVSGPGTFMERVIDRAIKSLNLVVQSGVCTMVVLDLIDVPAVALRRLPASTWFRIERAIEGSDTAVLILAAVPVARSAGGRSIVMDTGNREPGAGSRKSTRPGSRIPDPGSRHDLERRARSDASYCRRPFASERQCRSLVARAVGGHRDARRQRGVTVFAALYAPSVPAAALLEVARAFTPRFEQIGSVVLLDASGLSRLFGSAQELGEHLRDALSKQSPGGEAACPEREVRRGGRAELRVEGRIAMASTQTAATLLALGQPGLTVVMPGKEAIALAPLSVNVLDAFEKLSAPDAPDARDAPDAPDARDALATGGWHHPRSTHQASRAKRRAPENRLLDILTKWGIKTLGALTALSGPEIHERLGERGAGWQALARGLDARPMVPWVDEVPFEAALELEWPIEGLEPLSFVLARLLEPLSERLERADRGAAVIYTSLRLTSRTVFTRTLQLPAPMRDPKTLRTLILLDLESHPPDAPIDIVRVLVEPTPAKVLQWTLLERAKAAPEQVSTLTARLTALMGHGHVGSPVLVDTWRPGAFEMSDFRSQISDQLRKSDRQIEKQSFDRPSAIDQRSEISDLTSSDCARLRSALRRFRFPVPARVVVTEGRPIRIQLDRPGFMSGAIVQAAGPWRTSGNWWSASAREQSGELGRDHHAVAASGREGGWDRDEWDVEMHDGTLYRLVVERGVGQWFLEGVID